LVRRKSWGGEILSVSSDQAIVDAATSRYLPTQERIVFHRSRMIDFFQNAELLSKTIPIVWNQRKLDEILFSLSRLGKWDQLAAFIQSNNYDENYDTLISMIHVYVSDLLLCFLNRLFN
jgi:hypothetical protein